MICMCGGMIRSGSTLQYNLASSIVELTGNGRHIHANEDIKSVLDSGWDTKEYYVSKSHVCDIEFLYNRDFKQFRLLMTYRDLRDVLVSTQRFRRIPGTKQQYTFNQLLQTLKHDTVDREKAWLSLIPSKYIYRTKYEDMINNLQAEILGIAKHLDIKLSDSEVKQIYETHCLEATKKYVAQLNNMNAHTRYGPKHIGGVSHGQYKEKLSKEQIHQIESIPEVRTWLIANGYALDN